MLGVSDIVSRASTILADVEAVRWTVGDLTKYVGDGQRRVCSLKPAAYSATTTLQLALGTRQTLPVECTYLLDVLRNTTLNDAAPGRAITRIDRATLDAENPDWHSTPKASPVEFYVYDPETDSRTFYVYPQPKESPAVILAVVAKDPPSTTIDGPLSILPQYHEPLVDYVVARAIMRDAEAGGNIERANWHANAFFTGIGVGANSRNASADL